MLLAMMAARFMHHVSALCARTLETLPADWEISSSAQVTNFKNRACARCMAEQTGVHDVVLQAHARKHVPGHALELIVPVLMLPRARDDHARPAHERQRHTMGDTCIPPTPNQLLTAILSSTMQSSCLFRLSSVDCAACVHRSTAAAWPGPQVDSPISENLEGNGRVIFTTPPPQ